MIAQNNKEYPKAWCYQDRIWRQKDPTLGVICHQSCREKEQQKYNRQNLNI